MQYSLRVFSYLSTGTCTVKYLYSGTSKILVNLCYHAYQFGYNLICRPHYISTVLISDGFQHRTLEKIVWMDQSVWSLFGVFFFAGDDLKKNVQVVCTQTWPVPCNNGSKWNRCIFSWKCEKFLFYPRFY